MSRTTTLQESRHYDHVYDATVKFGGARDFNAATAGALRTAYKKVANANNLFSELPHHPRAAFVPKDPKALQPFNMPVDFQEHAAAIHEHTAGLASGTVRAAPLQLQELAVHGQQRYKFFRQPHTLVLNTALLKARFETAAPPLPSSELQRRKDEAEQQRLQAERDREDDVQVHEDGTRSIAIQTAYRDSAAQTDPYTPEYILPINPLTGKAGPKSPEVLRLRDFHVGAPAGMSLPAGKAEIEAIDFERRKAKIEENMPPTTDEASLEVRRRLMEKLEVETWRRKETALDDHNSDRVALVEKQLLQREQEREFVSEQRVEELRRRLEAATQEESHKLEQKRSKLQRRLGKLRELRENHIDMLTETGKYVGITNGSKNSATGEVHKGSRDIISEYAEYSSRVYAPTSREGRYPDKLRSSVKLDSLRAAFLPGAGGGGGGPGAALLAAAGNGGGAGNATVLNLRSSEPLAATLQKLGNSLAHSGLLKLDGTPPQKQQPTTSGERKALAIASDLERIHNAIQTVKSGKSTAAVENEKVPSWRRPKPVVDRPATPSFDDEADSPESEAFEQALLLVQTLLRGRAVQNLMIEGKRRRLELIREMRGEAQQQQQEQELLLMAGSVNPRAQMLPDSAPPSFGFATGPGVAAAAATAGNASWEDTGAAASAAAAAAALAMAEAVTSIADGVAGKTASATLDSFAAEMARRKVLGLPLSASPLAKPAEEGAEAGQKGASRNAGAGAALSLDGSVEWDASAGIRSASASFDEEGVQAAGRGRSGSSWEESGSVKAAAPAALRRGSSLSGSSRLLRSNSVGMGAPMQLSGLSEGSQGGGSRMRASSPERAEAVAAVSMELAAEMLPSLFADAAALHGETEAALEANIYGSFLQPIFLLLEEEKGEEELQRQARHVLVEPILQLLEQEEQGRTGGLAQAASTSAAVEAAAAAAAAQEGQEGPNAGESEESSAAAPDQATAGPAGAAEAASGSADAADGEVTPISDSAAAADVTEATAATAAAGEQTDEGAAAPSSEVGAEAEAAGAASGAEDANAAPVDGDAAVADSGETAADATAAPADAAEESTTA